MPVKVARRMREGIVIVLAVSEEQIFLIKFEAIKERSYQDSNLGYRNSTIQR